MNVLVFTSLYPNNVWPHHGVFVKERMTSFAKLDNARIKVVAPVPYFPKLGLGWRRQYSQVARKERRNCIDVYHPRYLMTPKVAMALYGWMMFLSVLPTIKKIKKDFDFDLIDSHYVYPDGFAAIQLGRFFKKPVVVSARGSDVNLYRTFPLIRKFLQYVLRKADSVVAVSQALKQSMVQLGISEGKISCIPNGVDAEKFYPMPREQARHQLGLQSSKMVLSVGNLTPNKGFGLLIKAFRILADECDEKDLQLAIVGEGAFRSELETMISTLKVNDRVHLVGAVSHDKLHLWYSAADLFCLASNREGWPNVILESLACGTPVVATPAGGIPEILSSDTIGLLTERDERKMATAISTALNKKWISDDLVEYARSHSWEHTASAVLGVFQSVLSARSVHASLERAVQAQNAR
jgi:teichuronic acid biosynthesis glycosyltransferase TuaC